MAYKLEGVTQDVSSKVLVYNASDWSFVVEVTSSAVDGSFSITQDKDTNPLADGNYYVVCLFAEDGSKRPVVEGPISPAVY